MYRVFAFSTVTRWVRVSQCISLMGLMTPADHDACVVCDSGASLSTLRVAVCRSMSMSPSEAAGVAVLYIAVGSVMADSADRRSVTVPGNRQ